MFELPVVINSRVPRRHKAASMVRQGDTLSRRVQATRNLCDNKRRVAAETSFAARPDLQSDCYSVNSDSTDSTPLGPSSLVLLSHANKLGGAGFPSSRLP